MNEQRPDPEKILQRVQYAEERERQGKLKIYLGAAPGVGKTHEMLHDACGEKEKGLDVVIGVAESHGRKEIKKMIEEFESIPLQKIDYQGHMLFDFDIDAALKRNPGLILIDEMAHTNAPGLRHKKRWQDIKELLDRGINVYTTLNVQHIESLNDDVIQIIRAPIKETVPDSMIDRADTIELVDLPPEELLKRLEEGKVYIADQAALAIEHFFRKGNLIALRELALRVMAERVNAEVLMYRQDKGITQIWPTKEKILVCVGPGNEALKLIRAARRMATGLQAEWMAVFVDNKASESIRNKAITHLRFAQQLGAETRVLFGFDIVKEITHFAREQNITQIMIWKYIRTRRYELFFTNLADEMLRHSGEIDVYIMTGRIEANKKDSSSYSFTSWTTSWQSYFMAIGAAIGSTLIDRWLLPYVGPINLMMVYLLSITLVALTGKIGPSIVATLISALMYKFFIAPFYNSSFDIEYLFSFAVIFIIAQVIGHLTITIRQQIEATRLSEQYTSALYRLTHQLASTRGKDKLLDIGLRYLAETFEYKVAALLPVPEKNLLSLQVQYGSEQPLSEKEKSIAQWVYDLGQLAGLGTDTLPYTDALYLPLMGSKGPIGVLRLSPAKSKRFLSPEQIHLLEACANQIGVAMEVDQAQEQKAGIQTNREGFISSALLKSVAHDLRTPLAAIMMMATNQMELSKELTPIKIKQLGKKVYYEAEQLTRLVNNFIQISYFESNIIKLKKKIHSLFDTISAVMALSKIKLGKRPIAITIPESLPSLWYDEKLIQDVFINLLDNVIKLTPATTPIEISAILDDNHSVLVSVKDRGPGIMPDEVNKLFEKYYRGRVLVTERGLGLGLAICQHIIKAHGGKIGAENRKEGGAVFWFTLPIILSYDPKLHINA